MKSRKKQGLHSRTQRIGTPLLIKRLKRRGLHSRPRRIGAPLLIILFSFMMIFATFKIFEYYYQELASKKLNHAVLDAVVSTSPADNNDDSNMTSEEPGLSLKTAPITVDFDMLLQKCPDVIAWLYCPDTVINYPVVQSDDNQYYLSRLMDGSHNTAGTLFADYRCSPDFSDQHTVIYGHNMKNNTMFGTLPEYGKQEYYEAHPVWYLITPEQNYKITLFAGYVTPSDSVVYGFEKTKEEQNRILNEAFEKTMFSADVDIKEDDCILIFSTCSYEYENARFVLMGILNPIK